MVRPQCATQLCEMVGEHALFETVGQIDHRRMLSEALDPVRAEGRPGETTATQADARCTLIAPAMYEP